MEKNNKPEEKELREGMNEIVTGTRQFKTKKYGLLQVRFPTVEEQRLADWEYSIAFNEGLKKGLMTNKEIEKMLEERDIWGEKENQKIEEIDKEIDAELTYLTKLKSEEKKKPVFEKINILRQQKLSLFAEKNKFFNISADSKAEEARLTYLTYKCTEKAETGERVWKTFDDFKKEQNSDDLTQIITQYLTFINGLPPNLLELSLGEEEKQEKSGEQDGE